MGILIYKKSIVATLNTIAQCDDLIEKIESVKNSHILIPEIQESLNKGDLLIGNGAYNQVMVTNELLDEISGWCKKNKMKISHFPEPHEIEFNKYTIGTNMVEVQGSFKNILKMLHYLEKNFKKARITAVDYHVKKNIETRKNALYAKLFIQVINQQ